MFLAILRNWQLILYVIVGGLVAYGGWYVKGRFERAADADRLASINVILEKQATWNQQKLERAEQTRRDLSAALDAARLANKEKAKEVVKTIRVHVHDTPECVVPVEVLKALNRQRGQPE